MNKHVLALSTALSILAFTPAFAQDNTQKPTVDCTQPANKTDPACTASNQQQNTTTQQQQDQAQQPKSGDNAASTTDPNATKTQDQSQQTGTQDKTQQTGQSDTQSTTTTTTTTAQQSGGELIVPADQLNSAKLMSASDYIGKTVYDQAGNNIGDVNDLIISNDGKVQAVILGVGGFLGIGEKDVAVNTNAIQMVQDGNNTRLVVEATKEALEAAPSYDKSNRRYATDTNAGTTTDTTGSTTAPAAGQDGKVTIDCTLPDNKDNAVCKKQNQQPEGQQQQTQ